MKTYPLLIALLFLPIILFATTLSGTVRDKAGDRPIEGVTVKTSKFKAVSSKDGAYLFPNLSPGNNKVTFSRYGYASQSFEVTLKTDSLQLNVELAALPISFPGITVTGERPEAVPASRVRIPREEAQDVPGAVRDAFKVLQTLPGVTTPTDFAGWLFVRGGDASENLYLMDSGVVLLPYHLLGLESVVNQDALGSLSFSAGGFSARYGNRLSSVVDIKNREPGPEIGTGQARASVDPLSASGTYDLRLTPGNAVLISGRWNYLDQFLKRTDIAGSTVRPHFSDLLLKWSGHWGGHSLSLTEMSTRDGALVTIPVVEETPPDTLRISTASAGNLLAFSWAFNKPGFEQALSAYMGDSREDFSGNAAGNEWREIRTDRVLGARDEVTLIPLPPSKIRLGLEVQGEKVDEDRARPENFLNFEGEIIAFKAKASSSLLSPYLETEQTWQGLTVQAGGRLDYSTAAGKGVFSPRVRVARELASGKLYLAGGRFAQFASPEYIALGAGESERANHFILGWERAEGPGTLRIETYYKPMEDLVSYHSGGAIGNQGWGRSSGIELFVRQERGKGLSGWGSLALSRSERVDLGDSVLSRFWADQPVTANIVLNYTFSYRTRVGLRFRGSSGPASTLILGRIYSETDRAWNPVYGPRNSERLPSYQRVDLRAERRLTWLGAQLTVYGEVLNLTNHQNLQGYIYNSHYSERAPFYMIPRIPFLGVEATW